MRGLLSFVLLLFAVLPCTAHSVVEKDGQYVVTHGWNYNNQKWTCDLSIPMELYQYYQERAHQSDDMVQFVLSDYDRDCMRSLVKSFREGGAKAGYSDIEDMGNVINFVQSLRYVTDKDSKGEEDYVRFPVETLVDGMGDCEDMAILAATILHEMGYGVMLALLPDHMALAVNCGDDLAGTYYNYEGLHYYYLEVTNTGWNIGQIPTEYKNSRATLVPLVYRPRLRLVRCSYGHDVYYSSDREVPYMLHCELENSGPGPTDGLLLRVRFMRCTGAVVVDEVFPLDEMSEGVSSSYELRVTVPRPFFGDLEIRAEGANFGTESMEFKDVDLQ